MSQTNHFTCHEWEELHIKENNLSEKQVEQLHTYAERAKQHLKKATVLTRTPGGLKADQVVGILQTPSATLEILPKIDGEDDTVRKALVHMLAETWDLGVTHGELASLSAQSDNLLEYFIRLFSERLLAAIRRGLPRRYLVHNDDLPVLRGKLNVVRQLTHLSVRPDRLACRFDELSENTPLNRVLKAAVIRLSRITRSAVNAQKLAELSSRFEAVGDTQTPLREPVRIDRTNTAFHVLYRLARFFLSGDWQSTSGGKAVTGFSLLFRMNDLFEEYTGRILKRILIDYTVNLQHRGEHALISEYGTRIFALRPDIVIQDNGGPIILDTKWKHLKPEKSRLDVSQSDVYQMLAYAHAYKAQRLTLIYPWHAKINKPPGLCQSWRVPKTDCPFDIVTVNVGGPDSVSGTLRDYTDQFLNDTNPMKDAA